MSPGIIGKKIGMTQIFRADGQVVPVTLVKAGPCIVVQRKTIEKDGYDAIQVGLHDGRPRKGTRAEQGHLKAAEGADGARVLREFRLQGANGEYKPGDRILVTDFKPNDVVDVVGTSKGRGFAGFVKRHHFRGGDATHGSMFHRAPGSIGASSFPSRVFPGMRMAGHMGDAQVTVRNLQVVEIDEEENLLVIKGAVPGPNGSYVTVRRAKRRG